MIERERRTGFVHWMVVVLVATGLAACQGDAGQSTDETRSEVDRQLDLALAAPGGEPELKDVGTPVPAEITPRPQPPGPAEAGPEASDPAPPEPPRAEPPPPEPEPAAEPVEPTPTPDEAAQPEVEQQPEVQPEEPEAQPEEAASAAAADAEESEAEAGTFTIPTGTAFQVTLRQELNTHYSRPGDYFMTTLTSPIMDADRVVVPAGATVIGQITRVQQPDGSDRYGEIEIKLDRLFVDGESYPIEATITQTQLETRTVKGDGPGRGGKAARGALTGAILGRVLGGRGKKGVLIGAAAGAAASAATAGNGKIGTDAVLAVGSQVSCVLNAPLTIPRLLGGGSTE